MLLRSLASLPLVLVRPYHPADELGHNFGCDHDWDKDKGGDDLAEYG